MLDSILIADKSPIFRNAIAKILIDCGFDKQTIAFVESDDDVLSFLEFTPCQLLVLGNVYHDSADLNLLSYLISAKTIPTYTLANQQYKADEVTSVTYLDPSLTELSILASLYETTQIASFKQRIESLTAKENKVEVEYNNTGKILIVDDEPANIDVAMGHLKSSYKVLAAKSGQQALDIAQKHYQSISVILLDIMMPGIDGFEVCRQLKSHEATKHIPVIFLSAKSEIDDVVKGLSLGAVDYIIKPFQPLILMARVKTHYQLAQQANALLSQVQTLEENAQLRESIDQLTRHDLKGPLARVLFEADKVVDKTVANDIRHATSQVLDMINGSLDVYKIEEGNYPLKPERTDVAQVITNAIKGTSILAEQKHINITFESDGTSLDAYAEPMLCVAIFNNLIKNAIEASPDNNEVSITLRKQADKIIATSLNKGAVPTELRENLFEKFSSSNHIKGSGFGTYSAKIMTEVQNGSISFEIIDESYTLFTLTLPAYNNE